MITLLFRGQDRELRRSYGEGRIVLGRSDAVLSSLFGSGQVLETEHIVIIRQADGYVVINAANDPFATLNGGAFGKRKISSGDVLCIGNAEIVFDAPVDLGEKQSGEEIAQVISARIPEEHPAKEEKAPPPKSRSPILRYLFLLALVCGLGVLSFGWYRSHVDESEFYERVAARDVADVAMALTYARVYGLEPPNRNWADADFLQEILDQLLGAGAVDRARIDDTGSLENAPYILRLYSSPDLEQFVLVAQPKGSVWQWIAPRDTIVLDTRTMVLRQVSDARPLNRMLTGQSALEGATALEVTAWINQKDALNVSDLAEDAVTQSFLSEELIQRLPEEAKEKVYNAPRYYRLSEPLARELAGLQEESDHAQIDDVKIRLKQLQSLSNFVLYSIDDRHQAEQALQALIRWFPYVNYSVALWDPEGSSGEVVGPLEENTETLPILEENSGGSLGRGVLDQLVTSHEGQLRPHLQRLSQIIETRLQDQGKSFEEELHEEVSAYATARVQAKEHFQRDLEYLVARDVNVFDEREVHAFYSLASELGVTADAKEALERVRIEHWRQEPFMDATDEEIGGSIARAKTLESLAASARKVVAAGNSPLLQELLLSRLEDLLLLPNSPLVGERLHPTDVDYLLLIIDAAGVEDPEQRDFYLKEFSYLLGP